MSKRERKRLTGRQADKDRNRGAQKVDLDGREAEAEKKRGDRQKQRQVLQPADESPALYLDAGAPDIVVAAVQVLHRLLVILRVGVEEEPLEDARLAHLARAHHHHAVPLVRVRHAARARHVGLLQGQRGSRSAASHRLSRGDPGSVTAVAGRTVCQWVALQFTVLCVSHTASVTRAQHSASLYQLLTRGPDQHTSVSRVSL